MSGEVYWITESFLRRSDPAGPRVDHDHGVLSVTPTEIATAQGFATVCRFTHRDETSQDGAAKATVRRRFPLEFDIRWARVGKKSQDSIAKGYDWGPVILSALATSKGEVQFPPGWSATFKRGATAMLWDNTSLSTSLHRPSPPADSSNDDVVGLEPGNLVDVSGTRAVVVSNATLHRHHRFRIVVLVPVKAGETTEDRVAIHLGPDRVAFEEVQTCQLLQGVHEITMIDAFAGVPLLPRLYARLAELDLIERHPAITSAPINREMLLAYLRRAAAMRKKLDVIVDPCTAPWEEDRPEKRRLPPRRGSASTGATPFLGEFGDPLAEATVWGLSGTLHAGIWHRDGITHLRLESEAVAGLDQVSVRGAYEGLWGPITFKDGWWEAPLGELGALKEADIQLNAIAPGLILSRSFRFSDD